MRMPVSQQGEVGDGQGRYPCLIQDMSRRGLLIVCSKRFAVGQVLELVSPLTPEIKLECTVEVRNVDEDSHGVRILEVSPQTAAAYQRYVLGFYGDKPPPPD
jgi:PilZ domain